MNIQRPRYVARAATGAADLQAALALRARCFARPDGQDGDEFDARTTHMLIEDRDTGALVCCFRLMLMRGADLGQSYAAQFYGLDALEAYEGCLMELGRFCIDPDRRDADVLRVAWAALTAIVDANDVRLLFGCASFAGVDPARHLDAFAMLRARHLAPRRWRPGVKAPEVFRFAARLRRRPDAKKAMLAMPPLLRTYLMMGGWVGDHAVVDHQMNTLHVFTGLEVAVIPDSRKRLLRALV